MAQKLNTKEVAVVKAQVSKALAAAEAVQIRSREDMQAASELLIKVKKVGRLIEEQQKKFTRPAYDAWRKIVEESKRLFAPLQERYKQAEEIIKGKMAEYVEAEEQKRREQEEKIAARVERGTMRFDTAAKKLATLENPREQVVAENGKVAFREVREVESVDKYKLPMDYLVPDMVKIRAAVRRGEKIPGVKVVVRKQVVAKQA